MLLMVSGASSVSEHTSLTHLCRNVLKDVHLLSFLKRMENVANFILSCTTSNCAFHRGPLLKGVSHLGSLGS